MSRKPYPMRLGETSLLMAMVCLVCESAFAQQDQAKQQSQTPPPASQGAAPSAQLKEFSERDFQERSKEALSKSSGKASPRIRNPKAGERRLNSSIIAVLQSQKRTADLDHAQALAAGHTQSASGHTGASAGTQASSAGNSTTNTQTPSQTGGKTAASSGALNAKGPGAPSLGPSATVDATGPKSKTALAPAPGGMLPPSGHSVNPKEVAQPLTAMACRGPGINTVNGKTKGTVFTPEQDYNLYTIKGCFFGDQKGQAYLYGKFKAQKINLQIDFWTDNEIDARVDPNVSGENDEDDVTLAIVPKSGTEMKAAGFGFYAAREPVPLNLIPSSWVKLDPTRAGSTPVNIEYISPVGSGWAASGAAASVYRSISKKFSPNGDYYDFSKLAPGWTTDSAQLFTYDLTQCPGVVTYKESFGTWKVQWAFDNPDNIIVVWSPTTCSGLWPPPPLPPFFAYANRTVSAYALKVWVTGPRGTSP